MTRKDIARHWLLTAAVFIAIVALASAWRPGIALHYLQNGTPLEKFTLVLFLVLLLPPLFRRMRLPDVVGLMAGGVLLGPYALAIIQDTGHPTIELFASLGRVFLMFIAGLEVDLRVFEQRRKRAIGFGVMTFLFPLVGGLAVAHTFGFDWTAALLIGSLLASHTLLGYPVLARLGLGKCEPVTVTLGATIFTDVASLLVLAACISVHEGGFSPQGFARLISEFVIYTIILLRGLPWLGRHYFRRKREDENALFVFTFLTVLVAAVGAHMIHLEDIVGAFLAGIAVNRVLTNTPTREKVVMLGEGFFIPLFFISIGLCLDLPVFASTIVTNLPFVAAIIGVLLAGKFLAASGARLLFRYDWPSTLTLWSLSLPQVAATLAAAMAAYDAVNAFGDHLITESVVNGVIVLMVVTAILGPVLTQHFGQRMKPQGNSRDAN